MFSQGVFAQLVPFGAQYYQNEYLGNPALAGAARGIHINFGYRSQWNTIPGAPKNAGLTADLSINDKIGVGVNINFDKAGLLSRSKIMTAFAYHLPLNNEEGKLHVGLSLAVLREQLATGDLIGSMNDPDALTFNDQGPGFDADVGIAYTTENLNLQFAGYNIRSTLRGEQTNTVDHSVFYTALAYKLNFGSYNITPKIAFRKISNFNSLFDAGMEIDPFQDKLKFTGIYHSNQCASFGFSYLYDSKYELLGMYSTPGKAFQTYTYGTFEVGFKITFATRNWWE